MAFEILTDSNVGGSYLSLDFRPLGALMLPGALLVDTLKAPICLVIATEEAIRGGITKIASLLFKSNPSQKAQNIIFKSFVKRIQQTAGILVALGLEDKQILSDKLKSGDIEELFGLSLLLTAYDSRHHYGPILLAKNTLLSRSDCPLDGLPLFESINTLSRTINEVLRSVLSANKNYRSTEETEREEARIACEWIVDIRKGETIQPKKRPDANAKQVELINSIITQIVQLKKIGMTILTESTEELAQRIR